MGKLHQQSVTRQGCSQRAALLAVDCFSPPDASNATAGIPDSFLSFMCLPAHTLSALSHSPVGVCVSALRHICKCVRVCCFCLDLCVQITVGAGEPCCRGQGGSQQAAQSLCSEHEELSQQSRATLWHSEVGYQ